MQQIIQEIINHIYGCGGRYSEWYCGIATNPQDRLFNDHSVDEKFGHWIFRKCLNSEIARAIEAHLLSLGFDGGSGGGDNTTVFVYVYYKTKDTIE